MAIASGVAAAGIAAIMILATGIGPASAGVVAAVVTSTTTPVPTVTPGNPFGAGQCPAGSTFLFGANSGSDASGAAGSGDVSSNGQTLTVTVNEGFTVSLIVVKGANNTNLYTGPFVGPIVIEGLVSPEKNTGTPEISHWIVCGSTTTTTTTTTGTTTTTTTGTTTTTTTKTTTTTTASTPVTSTAPGGGLPVTGASLGGLIAVALALVGGGVALLFFRRRRDVTDAA
jgi:LPXTG-motif cell wall-anchored protein